MNTERYSEFSCIWIAPLYNNWDEFDIALSLTGEIPVLKHCHQYHTGYFYASLETSMELTSRGTHHSLPNLYMEVIKTFTIGLILNIYVVLQSWLRFRNYRGDPGRMLHTDDAMTWNMWWPVDLSSDSLISMKMLIGAYADFLNLYVTKHGTVCTFISHHIQFP